MVTTTRKQIIMNKYKTLTNDLKPFLPIEIEQILPVIGINIDFYDAIFLFTHHFIGANENNYKLIINDLLINNDSFHHFSKDQLDGVYGLMKPFIFWFKSQT